MGMNRLLGQGTRYEYSIHAEEQAIKRLMIKGKILKHRHLSFLIIKKGLSKLGMSKPCIHCLNRIRDLAEKWKLSGVTVYYSTADGNIHVENVQNMSGIPSNGARARVRNSNV